MIRNGYIQIENICAPIGTLQWALNIRNIQTFGWMTFETYLGWWNELRWSDCFKIFAVSLIWRRPKCLIRICVTACFTWSGSKLVLFPLALIQCWWFKMHKFLSRKVFIWLTKLHLSSGITATCSEMVICSIFGSKMDTCFERSKNLANTDLTCGFNCLGQSTLQATFCCLYCAIAWSCE